MYGGNLKSWDTKYICAGNYFCAGNLCEFSPHGHYTHGGCRLRRMCENTGASDGRSEWYGKRTDSHCGVQLWSKKVGKDLPELPVAMFYSVMLYSVFFLIMEIVPEEVLLLFDASEEMLAIGVVALRIMAVSYLLSNVCLTFSSAFQGLGMGVQSMLLTLSRQVILPVLLIAAVSHLGELSFIWWAFVLAEAFVIPMGMTLWKKESRKALKQLTVKGGESWELV